MCTTGYMHGRVVANLGCSVRMIVLFMRTIDVYMYNVEWFLWTADYMQLVMCMQVLVRLRISIETLVNSPFHAVHNSLRL